MKLLHFSIGVLVVASLQTAALGKIIFDRAQIIRTGKEVVLKTQFVDPRDLFRGHYVILDFEIEEVSADGVEISGPIDYYDPVFIELKEGKGGFFEPVWVSRTQPQNPTGPVMLGEAFFSYGEGEVKDTVLDLRFPFDRYFAPKLRAVELENLRREERLGVIIALDGDGNGVIKGLTIDGKKIYDEPLF